MGPLGRIRRLFLRAARSSGVVTFPLYVSGLCRGCIFFGELAVKCTCLLLSTRQLNRFAIATAGCILADAAVVKLGALAAEGVITRMKRHPREAREPRADEPDAAPMEQCDRPGQIQSDPMVWALRVHIWGLLSIALLPRVANAAFVYASKVLSIQQAFAVWREGVDSGTTPLNVNRAIEDPGVGVIVTYLIGGTLTPLTTTMMIKFVGLPALAFVIEKQNVVHAKVVSRVNPRVPVRGLQIVVSWALATIQAVLLGAIIMPHTIDSGMWKQKQIAWRAAERTLRELGIDGTS